LTKLSFAWCTAKRIKNAWIRPKETPNKLSRDVDIGLGQKNIFSIFFARGVACMGSDFALALSSEMLWVAMLISAPVLGLSMLVGLIISVIQVVTQIQDMSLSFVPKILAVIITLFAFGPWMLNKLIQFSSTLIANIPLYF